MLRSLLSRSVSRLKETKGNKRIMQTAERVERFMKSLRLGKVYECEFNVLKVFRATDLMFECGLTYTAASRKAERACVNTTSILICWT